MHREHRNEYLSAMGIDLWQPVKPLPGAKKGHWIANPTTAQRALTALSDHNKQSSLSACDGRGPVVPSSALNSGPSSGSSPAHRDRLMAELQGIEPHSPNKVGLTPNADPVKQGLRPAQSLSVAESLSSFTLTASINSGLLIIDDVSGLDCASSAYQSWIQSLLLALGHPISQAAATSQQDQFVWPMPESGLSATSTIAPTEIFTAWLNRRIEEHKVNQLLLMGQTAVRVAAYESNQGLLDANTRLLNQQAVDVITAHSSAELWAEPRLKRSFWCQIQPFCNTKTG
ncbi:MAG: hypothetical protein CL691_01120 [Cellvibrionales bacterium]|nr:hypothetical protein [Cellvibrionales bacterium]|tara:strand:+ start:5898 stop:6755 length:858 start_codon:yes stop_codon:yes gene_type:complete